MVEKQQNKSGSDITPTMSFLEDLEAEPPSTVLRGVSAELESINHRPRYCNIVIFLIVVCSFSMNTGYIGSELTQLKTTFRYKFGWVKESP